MGMKVLEDGSVLVNFDGGEILARLDACGHPIWLKHGVYHHSIDRAEDDTFWTWRADHNAYEQYQYLVNLDAATGDTIREYSLIDDFIKKSPEQSLIFGVSDDYRYNPAGGPDLFHPNDIEPLHSAVADQFPDFRPGDLLVSIRNIHLVAVLDPIDKRVKWWSHGPWRFQHDPDFTPDGKILIYSNNTDRQHSSIISIDPKSRQVDVAGTRFYSGSAGKLQRLPNSATLLVVPDEGRVLEATWSGDLIFEFNNIWSDQVNAYVVNAAWLPATFFNETPSCHAEKVSP